MNESTFPEPYVHTLIPCRCKLLEYHESEYFQLKIISEQNRSVCYKTIPMGRNEGQQAEVCKVFNKTMAKILNEQERIQASQHVLVFNELKQGNHKFPYHNLFNLYFSRLFFSMTIILWMHSNSGNNSGKQVYIQ